MWEGILAHFWWVHFSQVSHITEAWLDLQGFLHSLHGYFQFGGPGLVSRSPARMRREQNHDRNEFEELRRDARFFLRGNVVGLSGSPGDCTRLMSLA